MLNGIPLDIIKYNIFPKLDLISQIRLRQVSKFFYNNLDITNLYDIHNKYNSKLMDEIIKKYPKLVKLDAWNNSKITNISHLKNLKILDAGGWNCGISDVHLIGLNLVELSVWNNSRITEKMKLELKNKGCKIID